MCERILAVIAPGTTEAELNLRIQKGTVQIPGAPLMSGCYFCLVNPLNHKV